jgi:hypothetical protein
MAYIGNIPAEKFTSVDIQNFSVSATANYTLDRPVANENEIELFINNVRQHPGSGKAYTASGTTLTLSEATAGTDTMYCVYQGKARQTVTPADSSVTNAMLAGSIDLTSKVTGLLPQANIADQAINEAKLQISNAPTNGYMLTAQSGNTGGLTWAVAPSGIDCDADAWMRVSPVTDQNSAGVCDFPTSIHMGSNVSEASNGRITVQTAGWYLINFHFSNQSAFSDTMEVHLRKNTTRQLGTIYWEGNTEINYLGMGATVLCEASANDIFDIYGSGYWSGNTNNQSLTWFSGVRLGA